MSGPETFTTFGPNAEPVTTTYNPSAPYEHLKVFSPSNPTTTNTTEDAMDPMKVYKFFQPYGYGNTDSLKKMADTGAYFAELMDRPIFKKARLRNMKQVLIDGFLGYNKHPTLTKFRNGWNKTNFYWPTFPILGALTYPFRALYNGVSNTTIPDVSYTTRLASQIKELENELKGTGKKEEEPKMMKVKMKTPIPGYAPDVELPSTLSWEQYVSMFAPRAPAGAAP